MPGNPNWVKGGPSPNPAGRPPKARETAILGILYETVGAQEWRAVFRQALLDALGVKSIQDPADATKTKLEKDPSSTPQARAAARKDLLAYGLGLPTQFIKVNDSEGDPFDQFKAMTTEQIEAMLAELDRLQSQSGVTERLGDGTAETP